MKQRGNIICTLVPGYPEVSGEDSSETLTIVYHASDDWVSGSMPDYGSYFGGCEFAFFNRYAHLKLTKRTVKPKPGGSLYEVSLIYSASTGTSADAVVTKDIEYSTQDTDIPIAQHEKYKTQWNHTLIAKKGVASIPDWWLTETTEKSPDAEKYKWSKPGDVTPDGWYILKPESKPGVESFRAGVTTVSLTMRSANLKKLLADASADYTIQTPPKTFGKSDGQWLRGGSKLRRQGKYWELSVDYLWSKKVDEEIYYKKATDDIRSAWEKQFDEAIANLGK